jgi:hypothetical protein
MTNDRNSELCTAIAQLSAKYDFDKGAVFARSATCADIVRALEQFQECVRYLNTRRSTGTVLTLKNESDVQDAVFLMLRLWIQDLVPENPTDRIGNRYALKDFYSRVARTVIEAKYIRDRAHGKSIFNELSSDIETYRHHAYCDDLIFFIYDADSNIPDQYQLRTAVEAERIYDGKMLRCHLIVKP